MSMNPAVIIATFAGMSDEEARNLVPKVVYVDGHNKMRRGERERVIWCLSCNVCLGRASRPETICPVNPAVGRDRAFVEALTAGAAPPRRIAVLGSSLSALTAAWIAARRGHRVTVFTMREPLGGMQRWRADVTPHREYGETIEAARLRAVDAGVQIDAAAPPAGEFDVRWVVRRFQPSAGTGISAYDVLAGHDVVAGGAGVPDRTEASDATTARVLGSDLAAAEAAHSR